MMPALLLVCLQAVVHVSEGQQAQLQRQQQQLYADMRPIMAARIALQTALQVLLLPFICLHISCRRIECFMS